MNKFYCISIFILLFLSSCVNAQSTEKYQISIMKFTKTLEGVNLPVKEVLVDSMGYVTNNQNKDIIKINWDSLKQSIQAFLLDDSIKEYKVNTYKKRNIFIDINPGETLNVSISKVSDLANERNTEFKSYYQYNKSFPYEEDNSLVYDFEKYFNNPESKKLIDLLHQLWTKISTWKKIRLSSSNSRTLKCHLVNTKAIT